MNNIVYLFLDIDGVLNNLTYLKQCYAKHGKSMSMCFTPFDPKCLNELMLLVQELESNGLIVDIILSSTWRISEEDVWIVRARLAEYGLQLGGRTPILGEDRGLEIQTYLKDKEYKDIIILDDDSFDIIKYYPHQLTETKFESGLTEVERNKVLDRILGKDRKPWVPKTYNPN